MMNLDGLFSEGDISNFDAMNDEQVYSVPEFNTDSMNVVEKKVVSKKDVIANQNKQICLKASKRLQHQGKTASEIKSYIKERFADCFIPEGLNDSLDKEEGIFGIVLVDCSSLEDKKDYDKLPLCVKNNHQYAIKCGCKNNRIVKATMSSKISGDINAFISEQDDFSEIPIATEYCEKTGLPVLKTVKDYTNEDSIDFLNKLEKSGEITANEKKNILSSASSPLNCAKKAFNLIHKKAQKETNKVVDNFNTYALGKNNTDVKVAKKGKESLKVSNLTTAPLAPEVSEQKENVEVAVPGGKIIPVAISAPAEKLININDFQEPLMNINKTELRKSIPVDVKNEIDIPVFIEKEVEVVPDIERGELVDTEWYENTNDLAQDVDVDDQFEGFSIDGSSKLLI